METGAGSGATHSPLQPPLARVIFSICLPQSGSAGQRGRAGPGDSQGEVTTELGSASGGTSCLTQVQSWPIEGIGAIGGHRI